MNRDVIITCAVTGSGDTAHKHPDLPKTPEQIANAAIEAAKAGAAIAHIHVREPGTGAPSRRVELFSEVLDRIRDNATNVIINLTTGMGGDLWLGPDNDPLNFTEDMIASGRWSVWRMLIRSCPKSARSTAVPSTIWGATTSTSAHHPWISSTRSAPHRRSTNTAKQGFQPALVSEGAMLYHVRQL